MKLAWHFVQRENEATSYSSLQTPLPDLRGQGGMFGKYKQCGASAAKELLDHFIQKLLLWNRKSVFPCTTLQDSDPFCANMLLSLQT
mmetsp:Transcript_37696/g.72554  ORF Transcript_37696/g.72554 Transcript_37696/m.72554 type:complete len:87 (-) Transcript_37696:277-537(-)